MAITQDSSEWAPREALPSPGAEGGDAGSEQLSIHVVPPQRPDRSARLLITGVAVSFLSTITVFGLCHSFQAMPLTRAGQVSAIAFTLLVQLSVLVVAGAAVWVLSRRGSLTATDILCGVLAGAASGAYAAGVHMALHGTGYGLYGLRGDAQVLIDLADVIRAGGDVSRYPDGFPTLLAWYASLRGVPTPFAMADMQVALTGMAGPLVFLVWRLTRGPWLSCILSIFTVLLFVEPYKPYVGMTLVIGFPLLLWIHATIAAARHSRWPAMLVPLFGGVAVGATIWIYPGWFGWMVLAIPVWIAAMPWRTSLRARLMTSLWALMGFLIVAWAPIRQVAATDEPDRYLEFNALVNPGFVLGWKSGGLPGSSTLESWPPSAPLAGLSVFAVLLLAGVTLAVLFEHRRTSVLLGSSLLSALILRYFIASRMAATSDVQLWPRTTSFVLYGLLVLGVIGAVAAVHWLRAALLARVPAPSAGRVLMSGLLVLGLASSWMVSAQVDRIMPKNDGTIGLFAWVAHFCPTASTPCPEEVLVPRAASPGIPIQ